MQPQLLLLCVVLLAHADGQTQTPQLTTATTESSAPTLSASTASSSNAGTAGGVPDWLNNALAVANQLANAPALQAAVQNSSQVVNGLMGQLPGLVQGLGAANLQGNDAAQLLARLFSDPRAAGIPAWIESLMAPGSNTSQSLQDVQTLLLSFSQQDPNDQVQALLAKVFVDVTQGLQSLNVTSNSTSQDVISAILNDPGLMSSLSSDAQQMMGVMGGSEVLMQLLQQQFPVDSESQCAADLSALGSGLQQGEMWALKMLDATGKLQSGVLTGQTTLFGDYDECLGISHVSGSRTIQGQFCSAATSMPAFMASALAAMQVPALGIHLCLPKSCATDQQIRFLLTPTLQAMQSQFYGSYCYPKPDPSGDPWFTGSVVTVGILALLCAAGTAYSAILDRKKDRPQTSPTKATANGHTNKGYSKDDGGYVNVNDGLTNGHMDKKEMALVEAGLTNGLDGSVGTKDGMANGQNGSVQLKDGTAAVNGTATDGTERSAAKESELSVKSSEEGLPSQLLLSFSVLRNGRKVLNCDKNSADISCLHGIRVLSITWVVLGHSFSMAGDAQANKTAMYESLQKFTYQALLSGVLAVDTFFMLSGFLSAFLFLRTTKKTGHLTVSSVVLYYVHRVWRLTPLYAVLLFVYTGIFPYLKEGPFQNLMGMDSESNCRDNWHLNLLYVNNLFPVRKMCFGWSWYLSNDMQFSFLAPLVIIPWCFRGRVKLIGFILAAGMIATHCISTGVRMTDIDSADQGEYMDKVYFKPWCRVGPYAVGLILGYILHVTRDKFTMTKMSWFLGWTMATALGLTLAYVRYDDYANMMTEGLKWGKAEHATYEALFRVLWAVCVSWVIFACTTGYGGFVNTLLSWSAWAPLSRLSYGVYLIHIIVLFVIAGNAKEYIYMDAWTGTELNLAATVLSFLLAFVFSMLVEAPTLGLEKAVLGRIFGKRK